MDAVLLVGIGVTIGFLLSTIIAMLVLRTGKHMEGKPEVGSGSVSKTDGRERPLEIVPPAFRLDEKENAMGDYGFDGAGEFGGTDFPVPPVESSTSKPNITSTGKKTCGCGHGASCGETVSKSASSDETTGSPREFEIYKDASGEFRWRLRAKNGRIIANSGDGYKNKADAEHAIGLVKNATSETKIEDLT